jgi:hypothetical protein
METKKEAVIKAVQSACPELVTREPVPCDEGIAGCAVYHCKEVWGEIQLHHVLRAIYSLENEHLYAESAMKLLDIECGQANHWTGTGSAGTWDLTKDLSSQEHSTIDFLHQLLVK